MYKQKEETGLKRIFNRSFAKTAAFAALFVVMLIINLASAMAYYQSHNLSEIRNIDKNLDMGPYQINTSRLNATIVVGNNSGSAPLQPGVAVLGTSTIAGVYGYANNSVFKGNAYGVYGSASQSNAGSAYGIFGFYNSSVVGAMGVATGDGTGYGFYGFGTDYGLYATSSESTGIYGQGPVYGVLASSTGTAVYGTGGDYGVFGLGTLTGVNGTGDVYGVYGQAANAAGYGVYGKAATTADYGYLGGKDYGVYGNSSVHAGYFNGNVTVTQNLTANYLKSVNNVTGTALCIGTDCRNSWPSSGVSGSGTANYIPKFSGASSIDNSVMYQSGSNIGIGTTTNINQRLEVSGNANVSGTLYASNVSSNSPLQLQTAGTTRMYISDSTGNVGVGSTNPVSTLSVGGDGISNAGIYASGTSYGVYSTGSLAVYGVGSGGGSTGVYGSGEGYGMHGLTTADGTIGVYGDAVGNNAYGVYGSSGGVGGIGVYGTGTTHGVQGQGGTYGVYGSSATYGVYGTGSTYGMYGVYDGSNYGYVGANGYGAVGVGTSFGLYGRGGSGVYGISSSSDNYGFVGYSTAGVYGAHSSGNANGQLGGNGAGVTGTGTTYGVQGTHSSNNYGQLGTASAGVYGYYNTGNAWGYLGGNGVGAYGDGTTYGVYGLSGGTGGYFANGGTAEAYLAETSTGSGVRAYGENYGVQGTASVNYGVYGNGPTGVYGDGNAYGGYFTDTDTTGLDYGIWTQATGAGGTTHYGIYSTASGATTNWAGYFGSGNVHITNDVAIGTGTTPDSPLDLYSDGTRWNPSANEGDFRIGTDTYRFKVGVATSGGGAGLVRLISHGGKAQVIIGSNGTDTLAVGSGTNTNYVGIGTLTPQYTLDVAGSAHATSFPTSSDERLKTNVTQLEGVLDKIVQIRGVSFDWNEKYRAMGRSTGHREIGVIAQEVEKVFPDLVSTWGDEDYRAVEYGRMSAVLIEAVKELKSENDAIKADNAALKQLVCLDHPDADICTS